MMDIHYLDFRADGFAGTRTFQGEERGRRGASWPGRDGHRAELALTEPEGRLRCSQWQKKRAWELEGRGLRQGNALRNFQNTEKSSELP